MFQVRPNHDLIHKTTPNCQKSSWHFIYYIIWVLTRCCQYFPPVSDLSFYTSHFSLSRSTVHCPVHYNFEAGPSVKYHSPIIKCLSEPTSLMLFPINYTSINRISGNKLSWLKTNETLTIGAHCVSQIQKQKILHKKIGDKIAKQSTMTF